MKTSRRLSTSSERTPSRASNAEVASPPTPAPTISTGTRIFISHHPRGYRALHNYGRAYYSRVTLTMRLAGRVLAVDASGSPEIPGDSRSGTAGVGSQVES